MELKFARIDPTLPVDLPSYQTEGAAGMDVHSAGRYVITPGKTDMIDTNLAVEVPEGFELQCRSRSGLAAKSSVFVLNSPGTIDSDYRGEIKVILHNAGEDTLYINKGDRVAQLVLAPVTRCEPVEVDYEDLSGTERGGNGFGSTGL